MKPIIRYMLRFDDGTLGYKADESRDRMRTLFGPKAEIVKVEIRVVERKKPEKKGKVKLG